MARALLLGLGLSLAATVTQARPAECYFAIGSDVIMDGRCDFDSHSGDGSFVVTSQDGRWFAYVNIDSPGVASGWWNSEPFASHAHTPLGRLYRSDACWVNDLVSVCAW